MKSWEGPGDETNSDHKIINIGYWALQHCSWAVLTDVSRQQVCLCRSAPSYVLCYCFTDAELLESYENWSYIQGYIKGHLTLYRLD